MPPLVFGAIVYRMVGLVPEVATFWKFLMVLVLFNLATASAVLLISVTFADIGVASLVVQWDTDIIVGAVQAGAARKLLHLRLRAGPTSEISIATNGCEVSRAEVMIRSAAVSVIRRRSISCGDTTACEVIAVVVRARLE